MLSVHPMQNVVLQFCSIMTIIRFTVNNICEHYKVFFAKHVTAIDKCMSHPLTNVTVFL